MQQSDCVQLPCAYFFPPSDERPSIELFEFVGIYLSAHSKLVLGAVHGRLTSKHFYEYASFQQNLLILSNNQNHKLTGTQS